MTYKQSIYQKTTCSTYLVTFCSCLYTTHNVTLHSTGYNYRQSSSSITQLKWLSKYTARKQVVFIITYVFGLQFGLTNKAGPELINELFIAELTTTAIGKLALFYFLGYKGTQSYTMVVNDN